MTLAWLGLIASLWLLTGCGIAWATLPAAWRQERGKWRLSERDAIRKAVKTRFLLMTWFWPFLGSFRLTRRGFDVLIDYRDPQRRERERQEAQAALVKAGRDAERQRRKDEIAREAARVRLEMMERDAGLRDD